MRKLPIAVAMAIAILAGCATITPEAQRVMIHSQNSTMLANCKRLGPVTSGEVSIWVHADRNDARQQAMNNLRDIAYKRYNADSVVLVNFDHIGTSVIANGIALDCRG